MAWQALGYRKKFILSRHQKVMKLMHSLKMGLLFVGFISSFSFASIARAGERWPGPEKSGNCPLTLSSCQYNTYQIPPSASGALGIGGFYVNLTSPDSSALITWTARQCESNQIISSGSKDISTSSTGQNYIDFPSRVCNFTFTLLNPKRYRGGGDRVDFLMNYDVDY